MKLFIANSGGETSAYMTNWLLSNKHTHKLKNFDEIVVVFANTGQEHENTLKFINNCDKYFNFKTVWVEAVVNEEKGKGTSFKIVNYDTASRDGRPFEDVIRKYGIPNQTFQICSRELKTNTIKAYLRSLGWKSRKYYTAIGIRNDEVHRVASNYFKNKILYPLISWNPVVKEDIKAFWKDQAFNLGLPEHFGNCSWCWKKSRRKLLTLAKHNPTIFDFPSRMEMLYGAVGTTADHPEHRVFFRGKLSTQGLLTLAEEPFCEFVDKYHEELDASNGCTESCEPFYSKD